MRPSARSEDAVAQSYVDELHMQCALCSAQCVMSRLKLPSAARQPAGERSGQCTCSKLKRAPFFWDDAMGSATRLGRKRHRDGAATMSRPYQQGSHRQSLQAPLPGPPPCWVASPASTRTSAPYWVPSLQLPLRPPAVSASCPAAQHNGRPPIPQRRQVQVTVVRTAASPPAKQARVGLAACAAQLSTAGGLKAPKQPIVSLAGPAASRGQDAVRCAAAQVLGTSASLEVASTATPAAAGVLSRSVSSPRLGRAAPTLGGGRSRPASSSTRAMVDLTRKTLSDLTGTSCTPPSQRRAWSPTVQLVGPPSPTGAASSDERLSAGGTACGQLPAQHSHVSSKAVVELHDSCVLPHQVSPAHALLAAADQGVAATLSLSPLLQPAGGAVQQSAVLGAASTAGACVGTSSCAAAPSLLNGPDEQLSTGQGGGSELGQHLPPAGAQEVLHVGMAGSPHQPAQAGNPVIANSPACGATTSSGTCSDPQAGRDRCAALKAVAQPCDSACADGQARQTDDSSDDDKPLGQRRQELLAWAALTRKFRQSGATMARGHQPLPSASPIGEESSLSLEPAIGCGTLSAPDSVQSAGDAVQPCSQRQFADGGCGQRLALPMHTASATVKSRRADTRGSAQHLSPSLGSSDDMGSSDDNTEARGMSDVHVKASARASQRREDSTNAYDTEVDTVTATVGELQHPQQRVYDQLGRVVAEAALLPGMRTQASRRGHKEPRSYHYYTGPRQSGDKVSTACHVCQSQHVAARCQWTGERGPCMKSYCTTCVGQMSSLPYSSVMARCLSCRGLCLCKNCMRKVSTVRQERQYSSAQRREFAEYALQALSPAVLLAAEDAEARASGCSLEEVPYVDMGRARFLCNVCGTSLANLHRHCDSCGWDVCAQCCAEARQRSGGTLSTCLQALHSGPGACRARRTRLARFLDDARLAALRGVQQAYATPASASHPTWRWVTAETASTTAIRTEPAVSMGRSTGRTTHELGHVSQCTSEPGATLGQHCAERSPADEQSRSAVAPCRQTSRRSSAPFAFDIPPAACDSLAQVTTPTLRTWHDRDGSDLSDASQLQAAPVCGVDPGAQDAPAASAPLQQRRPAPSSAVSAAPAHDVGASLRSASLHVGAAACAAACVDAPSRRARGTRPALCGGLRNTARSNQPLGALQGALIDDNQEVFIDGGSIHIWGAILPLADVRQAAVADHQSLPSKPDHSVRGTARAAGVAGDYIFTPHNDSFQEGSLSRPLYTRLFQQLWAARQPIVVRGVKGRLPWDPDTMMRASRELSTTKGAGLCKEVEVLYCDEAWRVTKMSQDKFFRRYKQPVSDAEESSTQMLKVKDWPPDDDFKRRLPRHNQDFEEMSPLPEYTHLLDAPLNLASYLPQWSLPTDLGPKTYVASGRLAESRSEGDSVTKLHQDMSDAINVMTNSHIQAGEEVVVRCGDTPLDVGSRYGCSGAMWDLWRWQDAAGLGAWALRNAHDFKHLGETVVAHNIMDPVFDQCFMLNASHLAKLKRDTGIQPWHFEQYQDEAVFIPAGCPHQVRNLRSCIKVAVDFVSPPALHHLYDMAQAMRECVKKEQALQRKLVPASAQHINSGSNQRRRNTRHCSGARHGPASSDGDDAAVPEWVVPEDSAYADKLQGALILMTAAAEMWVTLHPEAGPLPGGVV